MKKKDKFLNVEIDTERKPISVKDEEQKASVLKTMREKSIYEGDCVNKRKEKNQKYINKKNSSFYQEQFLKIGGSNYILPNRFAVKLYNDKYNFEPYEFLSYFENKNELTFYIRLTKENIKTLYGFEKNIKPWYIPTFLFNKKFIVDVKILDSTLEDAQIIKYKDCYVTRVDYPYFEYGNFGDGTATVKIFLKYKNKKFK